MLNHSKIRFHCARCNTDLSVILPNDTTVPARFRTVQISHGDGYEVEFRGTYYWTAFEDDDYLTRSIKRLMKGLRQGNLGGQAARASFPFEPSIKSELLTYDNRMLGFA